uniref:Uncharacterized protein n=1 Tax=Neobodo designis TaxID=312471 RepID=A0A7S1L878_NEODS
MAPPEVQRGPRSEGVTVPTNAARASPTLASDRALLQWQLRRALLFKRREDRVCSWLCRDASDPEELLCNVLCGAAVIQTAADPTADGGSDALSFAPEVAATLDLPVARAVPVLENFVARCRGRDTADDADPAASVDLGDTSTLGSSIHSRQVLPATPEPRAHQVSGATDNLVIQLLTEAPSRFANSFTSAGMLSAIRDLPVSFKHRPAPDEAPLLSEFGGMPSAPRRVFGRAPDLKCLAHCVRFKNGVLLVVTNWDGVPLYVSDGGAANVPAALQRFASECARSRSAAFGNLRLRSVGCGGVTGVQSGELAQAANPCFHLLSGGRLERETCAAAVEVVDALRKLTDWRAIPVPQLTTDPTYRWFRLLLYMVGCAIRQRRQGR